MRQVSFTIDFSDCGKNMLDYSMFLFRMVTTCCCSVTLPSWSVARKCCSRQVSSCVAPPCYLRNTRYTTPWLLFGLGGAHPRVPMRHISTKAVCIEPKRQMHTIHAWIVPSCVVSARTVHVVLEPTLRAVWHFFMSLIFSRPGSGRGGLG